jgi:hypothetical protein
VSPPLQLAAEPTSEAGRRPNRGERAHRRIVERGLHDQASEFLTEFWVVHSPNSEPSASSTKAAGNHPRPHVPQPFQINDLWQEEWRRGELPPSLIPQVVSAYCTCVEQWCQCLHYVCTDEGLAELVASGPRLTPEVRAAIMQLVRRTGYPWGSDGSRAATTSANLINNWL